jgi:hypothetical protein
MPANNGDEEGLEFRPGARGVLLTANLLTGADREAEEFRFPQGRR